MMVVGFLFVGGAMNPLRNLIENSYILIFNDLCRFYFGEWGG